MFSPVGDGLVDEQLGVDLQRRAPHRGRDHGEDAVEHEQGGHDGHEDEPEPHEDVDLLVEDVDRQHAEAVKVLD